MSKSRTRFSILQIFGVLALVYFGTHVVIGYLYCEYSDYANCPGYTAVNTEDHEETDNK